MHPDFAQFTAELCYEDLPKEVLETLRRSFTDTMGVAAVGSTTPLAHIVRRVAPLLFGPGSAGAAPALMAGGTYSPVGAAMAGAFTVDSIDAHDGSTPCKGHAGSAVFPALIAMVQACTEPIDGKHFATLLATAYEVSYRAGLVQHATCADYHTSGAWTAVGVAAAGAKWLSGTPDHIRHAAGIGEYHGPRSQMMRCIDHPTMLRDGVGWGAPTGVTAAYLACEGFTGAPALTCESDAAAPFWADLGQGWRLLDHTHYKAYPCCRWAHPSLDGAKHLMQRHAIDHRKIKRVEIRTFHYATRLAGHEPKNQDEFTYAIAFPVAAMIVRGELGIEALSDAAFHDPDILRVSRTIELIDDTEMTRRSTEQRWSQVSIILKDGQRFDAAPRTPRGDTDQPLSEKEMSTKFHQLADPVLGKARADRLEDLSSAFDSLGAAELHQLLQLCTDAPSE